MNKSLCLIGCGATFEMIAADAVGYGLPEGWIARQVESVSTLSSSTSNLLDGLVATDTQIFVAVDQNALNYARLELYGAARLRGFRMAKLTHKSALVAPDAKINDNVLIGPRTLVASKVNINSDVLVSPGVRLDVGAHVGAHCWIGPGASVGAGVVIGSHSVIGADMRIREGIKIGKHCVLDTAITWSKNMADGSFVAPQFDLPARIIGAGYSFTKAGG